MIRVSGKGSTPAGGNFRLAKHIELDTFVLQVSQLLDNWHSAELRRVGGLENCNGYSTCNLVGFVLPPLVVQER
jgi:hypothetical protein